jgi:hypothetical protein
MSDYQDAPTFNPSRPVCPECGRPLTRRTLVDVKRYPDKGLTMFIHICRCNSATGFVVADDPNTNVDYVMKQVK